MTAEAPISLPLRGAPVPDDLWDPADCRALWIAALEMYLRDAIAAARGSEHREAVAALHDLIGGCEMLARLCEPLGLEVEPVAAGMRARAYS